MNPLAAVRRITIDAQVIDTTLDVLQEVGDLGCECLVLWLGTVSGDQAVITDAYVPDQRPIQGEQGVGYFVPGEALFRLNQVLSTSGLRLIAQVHSHPSDAYHSHADDEYAIVTAEGGLSLVVPDFGHAPPNPTKWAVYRLESGLWQEVSQMKLASLLELRN
jgi:hypothetical protein